MNNCKMRKLTYGTLKLVALMIVEIILLMIVLNFVPVKRPKPDFVTFNFYTSIFKKIKAENEEKTKKIEELTKTVQAKEEEIEYLTQSREDTYSKTYSAFKAYMDYRKITCITSNQYQLQQKAVTCPTTGIRMVDDRYCIAIGTGWNMPVGTKCSLIMVNGAVIPCIVGDIKADIHTDVTNIYHLTDGSVCEFVIDVEVLPYKAKIMGDVSWVGEEFKGEIINIIRN